MSKKDKLFDSDDDEPDYNPDDDLGFSDSPVKQPTPVAPKQEFHQP